MEGVFRDNKYAALLTTRAVTPAAVEAVGGRFHVDIRAISVCGMGFGNNQNVGSKEGIVKGLKFGVAECGVASAKTIGVPGSNFNFSNPGSVRAG